MKQKNQTNHGQNIPTSEHVKTLGYIVKTLQCNVSTTIRHTITTTCKDARPCVSTIILTLLILILTTCKELGKSKPETHATAKEQLTLSYVVTFAIGKATADGKPVKSGDVLTGEPKLTIPATSQLDIQVKGMQSDVKLRMKSNTDIQFYARKKNGISEFLSFVKKGSVLYSIAKLNKEEGIIALTPLTRNVVRGTQFKVVAKEDGTSSIAVGEGAVQTSYSTPVLEALSDSDLLSPKSKQEVDAVLEKSKVIEAGKEITISKKDAAPILDDPELKALLDSPSLQKIDTPVTIQKDEALEKHLAAYEAKHAEIEKDKEQLAKKADDALKLTDNKESLEIKKESTEITQITLDGKQNAAEIKKAVDENIKGKKEELIKNIEKVYGKGAETLRLRNGGVARGVIFERNGVFIVNTPEGEQQYSDAQVSGYSF